MGGIENVAQGLVAVAAGLAAGLLAYAGARRLGGLSPRRRARRRRGEGITRQIQEAMPLTAGSEAAAREAIERSGMSVTPAELWASRLLLGGAGVLVGATVGGMTASPQGWLLVPALGVAGAVAPQLALLAHGRRWRDEIERELPNALDLLAVSVAAGTSFEAGVRIVATRTEGALADGLADVCAAAEYSSMAEALEAFAKRAQVQPLTIFVASLVQAQRSGIPLADILRSQSESVRTYRRQRLEERINKLPTQLILPEMLIFVATIVAIMAPAVAQIAEGLL